MNCTCCNTNLKNWNLGSSNKCKKCILRDKDCCIDDVDITRGSSIGYPGPRGRPGLQGEIGSRGEQGPQGEQQCCQVKE